MRYLKPFRLFEAEDPEGGEKKKTVKKMEPKTVPFEYKFKAGFWSEEKNPELEKELRAQIEPIKEYLQKYKNNAVTIKVLAGESQVTNYDNEAEERTKLEPGDLSNRRAETIGDILSKIIDEYKEQKLISKDPNIEVEGVIGETPYSGPKDLKDPDLKKKYDEEQFVKFTLSVEGEEITYDVTKKLIPKGQQCNKEFEPEKGYVSKIDTDFLSKEYKFEYPDPPGKIVIETNPAFVPDMFIYEYNKKTYNTKFLGEWTGEYYQLYIGTIIHNAYKTKEKPWYFKDLKLNPISVDAATEILKSNKEKDDKYEEDNLEHAFPGKKYSFTQIDLFKKNQGLVPMMLDKEHFLNTSEGSTYLQRITQEIDKLKGVNELKVWSVALCGTTVWQLKFKC